MPFHSICVRWDWLQVNRWLGEFKNTVLQNFCLFSNDPISLNQVVSDPIYPQALLDAMAGNDEDPVCPGVDPSIKQDVETIARNLSQMEDSLFYLKTTSEIIRKWPSAKVRVFMQDLLKLAMEEDNKMRFANE